MSSWYKQLAIILPTFNESKNLRELLQKIRVFVPGASITIVDDSKTAENKRIKKIASEFKHVTLITREKKQGRGGAVLAGFVSALENKKLEYFVEMDTDLAHDPKELELFQKSMQKEKVDVVIGSRYVAQSKIIDWPFRRLFLSKLINFFLNVWFGLKLHDYTNGYRMYKRKAVVYLVKTGLHEKNFIALSESAFLLKKKKMRIIEIPTAFTDRKRGESSVSVSELFACLIGALRIKLRYLFIYNK